jgi:methylmalonyl-CoA mutase
MSDANLDLTQDFPPASYDAWRAVVDQALKGAPFEKKLTTRLYDGITLQPIYTRADGDGAGDPAGFPGFAPFARSATAGGSAANGWDIRQAVAHPDIKQANKDILADLEGGATSVLLRLDACGKAGLDPDDAFGPDLAGVDGVMIATADDLDSALAGVMLDICPVALDAGAGAVAAAALMVEVWRKRGCTGEAAMGAFNIDPLGTLAATGQHPQGIDKALADMAAMAAWTAAAHPNVTAVGVDTSAIYKAGASDVLDLGAAMATGVAYLRALTAAGLSIDDACRQIAFTVPVGTDQFLSIAKLRAARMLWARVAEACGATPAARRMTLTVDVSDRVLSQRDPWVNMLRVTVGVFAAAVGQADAITAPAFEAALGLPSGLGRRVARNTQIILAEESNLGRVIDPAGGAWYVETLTRQVAERAWEEFQAIEGLGGMAEALASGALKAKVDEAWEERRKAVARRKDSLTGINEFPNLTEKPVEVATPDIPALQKGAVARLTPYTRSLSAATPEALVAAAGKATLGALTKSLGGAPVTIDRLPPHRLAEDWEALRDASDMALVTTSARPRVFLANMGRVAQHTARATYARNFFEAGGIEAPGNDGFADAESAARAFAESGAKIAVICGGDDQYAEAGAAFAEALKGAGASRVYMAGRPGDAKAAFDAAGTDDYIFVGCEALDILRSAHAHLGVPQP